MTSVPWLSIITVVKDDPEGYRATRASVLAQDALDIEHVTIDSSQDREAVAGQLPLTDPAVAYSWCPPRGIYPAMNAGLAVARGSYVMFMNAGDVLLDGAISAIRKGVERERPVWLFGQVRFINLDGTSTLPPPFDYERERATCFARGRFPPHQATVTSRAALEGLGGFDTTYVIAADYKAMLQLSQQSPPTELSEVIADFAVGGASQTYWRTSVAEFHRARKTVFAPTGWDRVMELAATTRQYLMLGLRGAMARAGV